ncbi:ferric-dicitrate binding protein FerR (iron transport regulator) [Pedobacter cryoconitis]|uniref:FecR family protein n=1 Tax=Pedobacter cryoconitis TaxID=188932 RepID=UPI00161F34A9|nr:FecR domain-containing protein [Pedobacter cryoconitis]MBB6274099.1 ferric-dicitrate binding protein FerR (iron transport regulator) [Pedobacter cryoconitis]
MEELYYQLITEYYHQTITDRDLTILQEWVASDSLHETEFREVILILDAAKLYYRDPKNQDNNWNRIAAHIRQHKQPVKRKFPFVRLAMAALLLLIIGLGINHYRNYRANPANHFAEITIPYGQQTSFILPDSSIVYLNAGSKLKYPKHFAKNKRIVQLEGEAFFEIRHAAAQPFIIQTGKVSTTASGTSFNVKAFPKENHIAITVKTGKADVVFKENNRPAITDFLLPDQQLRIDTKTGKINKTGINAEAISDWRSYRMVFCNATLKEIASTIERTYKLDIELEDPTLANIKVTTSFNKTPLDQILKTLATLTGSHYTRSNNTILFFSAPSNTVKTE